MYRLSQRRPHRHSELRQLATYLRVDLLQATQQPSRHACIRRVTLLEALQRFVQQITHLKPNAREKNENTPPSRHCLLRSDGAVSIPHAPFVEQSAQRGFRYGLLLHAVHSQHLLHDAGCTVVVLPTLSHSPLQTAATNDSPASLSNLCRPRVSSPPRRRSVRCFQNRGVSLVVQKILWFSFRAHRNVFNVLRRLRQNHGVRNCTNLAFTSMGTWTSVATVVAEHVVAFQHVLQLGRQRVSWRLLRTSDTDGDHTHVLFHLCVQKRQRTCSALRVSLVVARRDEVVAIAIPAGELKNTHANIHTHATKADDVACAPEKSHLHKVALSS